MKLTAQVKLLVTPEQADALKRTMQAANAVCDSLSAWAWANQTFGQYPLHKGQYAAQRASSGLTAQVIVRAIGKVADSYKLDKRTQRTFLPTGAIAFDGRILRWYVDKGQVSIWSVEGRLKLPFVCGEYQRGLLAFQQGESDLAFVNGHFYLMATVSIPDPPLIETDGVLGVDLGIVQLATDSEGRAYSGEPVKAVRRRAQRIRALLQSKGTKNAKKHLQRMRQRTANYQRWVNHNISKQLVQNALLSRKAIALEDLKGIRERASAFSEKRGSRERKKARKVVSRIHERVRNRRHDFVHQTARRLVNRYGTIAVEKLNVKGMVKNHCLAKSISDASWSMFRSVLTNKAESAGRLVVSVNPAYTSQMCSGCGNIAKKSLSVRTHRCLSCGLVLDRDTNAAVNIKALGQYSLATLIA